MYREQKSQGKSFGLARDYYRIRLIRVDEERPEDFEWRSDILYSSPKAYPSKRKITYRLHVLTADNEVHEIAILFSKREAKRRLRKLEEDLHELTKMKFDEKYTIEDKAEDKGILIKPPWTESMLFTGVNRSEPRQNNPVRTGE